MTTRDEIGPGGAPSTGPPADLLEGSIDRHPTAIGRRLDIHLAAVAEALRDRGILTGSPRRTDAAHRLIGSIVLDCNAVRSAAGNPSGHPGPGRRSLDGVVPTGAPAPVIATWDEQEGWCVGLHEDPVRSSRRYLHADLLPPPQQVAGFVVGLALGTSLGSPLPLSRAAAGLPRRVGVPGVTPPASASHHRVEHLGRVGDASSSCEFTLVADSSAPRASREPVGGWLTAARWPEDELDAIVYAVSEAVSNAAEHAYPPGSSGRSWWPSGSRTPTGTGRARRGRSGSASATRAGGGWRRSSTRVVDAVCS